ncbi:MAG: MurR/RpiR family transcriptional regulator [Treponema sp.]|jgi:DNA-binding MurR/RpiR family transcriptional regulator|nr:MurR/RpiR family transcriptional regulator [Treponema sp.]
MPLSQATPLVMLQIKNRYSEFNPAMKQIADYLFESGDKVLTMGISQLATASGVSIASVTRFVRLLRFSSFKSFQLELAKAAMNGDESVQTEPADNKIVFEYGGTSPHDSVEEVGKKVFQSNIQMLSDTMQTIDYKKMEYVTNLIINVRNLVFLGVGRSYVTAESGRIRFNRLGINSFSYSDTQEQIVAATTCSDKDVFFGISNFGRSAAVVHNIYEAKLRGAVTVGITSADGSPLTQTVDVCFLTAFNNANMEYRTHKQAFEPACENIAQMVLLDCIYMNVALKQDKSCFDMFYNTVKVLSKERL